jgi:crossover junction endodeoxyribonuclease RuvC
MSLDFFQKNALRQKTSVSSVEIANSDKIANSPSMKTSKNNFSLPPTIRILGIDPGTATTGWAIIEGGKNPAAIAYGCIETKPDHSDADRLREIAEDLEKICRKYQPDEAAVEKLFFFKNQKTIISVAQGRGVILLTLAQNIRTIAEYTPLQIKQALTGYGRAEKQQIQEMVRVIFKLSAIPKPDDAADALAIAFCHMSSRRSLSQ